VRVSPKHGAVEFDLRPESRVSWSLRYCPHLGYMPPDRMLFRRLGGPDRPSQVRFAAREGFAGVLYPWAADSPPEERRAVAERLAELKLACSCIATLPFTKLLQPLWVTDSSEARESLLHYVANAVKVAQELGSSTLVAILVSDTQTSGVIQRQRAVNNLRMIADLTANHNIVLGVEPMVAVPDALLRTFAAGVDLVRGCNHPAVKLIFDTGHLIDMREPVLQSFVAAYDDICLLQLADMPGRVEPGKGEIDFVQLLAHAIRRGYSGLVDLEHDWLSHHQDAEQAGINNLMKLDSEASAAALRRARAD
jgi:hydroxypyruvate isomerase